MGRPNMTTHCVTTASTPGHSLSDGGGVAGSVGFMVKKCFFCARSFAFWLSTTSFARNFAMRSISFTGTGSDSGKRFVPFASFNAQARL